MLANAFTASPRGRSPSITVTTVTPVTNCRFTCFIRSASSGVEGFTVSVIGPLLR